MRRMYVKRSQKLLKMITSLKRPWNSGRFPLYFTHHTFCDFSWRSHYIHHQNWPLLQILVCHANCTPISHFSHAPPDFYLSLGWSGSCMKRLTKLKQLKNMRPTNLTRGYLLVLLTKSSQLGIGLVWSLDMSIQSAWIINKISPTCQQFREIQLSQLWNSMQQIPRRRNKTCNNCFNYHPSKKKLRHRHKNIHPQQKT